MSEKVSQLTGPNSEEIIKVVESTDSPRVNGKLSLIAPKRSFTDPKQILIDAYVSGDLEKAREIYFKLFVEPTPKEILREARIARAESEIRWGIKLGFCPDI